MAGTFHRAQLNKYALGTAMALVIAPLAGADRAIAAPGCSPASGQDGAVVTCSADATNQDGNNGFGQGTEKGVTLTVNGGTPGVTVTGSDRGIALGDNANITVQSGATVAGTNIDGIAVGNGSSTVTNAGTISGRQIGIDASVSLDVQLTVHNTGAVTGATGVFSGGDLTIDNTSNVAGTTNITGALVGLNANKTVTVTSNNARISGGTNGITATHSNVTNNTDGLIEATSANGIGIGGFVHNSAATVTLANDGTVRALGAGGIAVQGQTVTVSSNTNTIAGDAFGINATGTATVTNKFGGTISAAAANGIAIGDNRTGSANNTVTLDNAGTVQATGTGGIALQGFTVNVNSNTGSIIGDKNAIAAFDTANVTNSKTITANASNGEAIRAQTANVNNLAGGSITSGNNGGVGIAASTVVLNNAGTITADFGVSQSGSGSATIVNSSSGSITGSNLAIGAENLTLTNSNVITGGNSAVAVSASANINNLAGGMISATDDNGTAIGGNGATLPAITLSNAGTVQATGSSGIAIQGQTLNVNNLASGTISGNVAIQAAGAATITNFGTIKSTAGATGTAIQLSSAADTLNIKRGSTIIGMIDMGGGADVINVDGSTPSVAKGVSMLSRAASAVGAVVDAIRAQLTPDSASTVINVVGGNGSSTSGQPNVTVNGLTASLDPTALAQQDRTLMDFTGGMSSMVQDRLRGSATGGASGPMAMSYAMEDAGPQMFSKAPLASWNAPVTVWSSGFGAFRKQNGTDTTLDSTSSVAGGVIGIDRRIAPNWLVGVFAGGGSGAINVDMASQKIDTDYFSIGAYSRFEWDSQFFDATLQGGGINNRSSRLVQNTINGGLDHATASYNGWFISPEIAYGYKINLGNGTTVTPTARVRYVAGTLDGFTETGSQQTLSVGSRTLQDFEERAEVEISKTGFFGDPSLKGWFRGGAIAIQRVGDATVNAVLIGQSLSFVTPGKNSAVGGVGSVGFDYRLTPNVSLYGSLEGMMMSDESKIGSARGGVKVAF